MTTFLSMYYYYIHFTNEETEEQRSYITCPRLQSDHVSGLDLESVPSEQGPATVKSLEFYPLKPPNVKPPKGIK